MNVKVFTFKGRRCRIRDVEQLLVASRAEAVEAGIDKPDPWCRPHSLTKSLRNCIIANPQTFKGRRCRIRDVEQLLVASRAEAVEAGIDKPDPWCRPHSLTKSLRNCIIANPQT